jgi:hypothetical protein
MKVLGGNTMRIVTFGLATLAAVVFSTTAWSSSIPEPYWQFDYDISDSIFWVDAPVIGVQTVTMGTGTMTIERGSLDQDGGAAGLQAQARLAAFDFDVMYSLSGVINDMTLTMHGDANGDFNSTMAPQIVWDADPAIGFADGFQSIGTITCTAGSLVCGFAGLPDGTPVKVNATTLQDTGAGVTLAGVQVAMVMPTIPDPPSEYRIAGVRTAKICIGGDTSGGGCDAIVPEPSAGILVGLGVLGVALVRYRRR